MPRIRVLALWLLCIAFSSISVSVADDYPGSWWPVRKLQAQQESDSAAEHSFAASGQPLASGPSPGCAPSPLNDSALAAALDGFIHDYLACTNIGGLQVGLIRGGKIVYSKAFGIADAQTQQPVDTQTVFGLGSTSKAFTSLLLGQLVDAGVLYFDNPLSRILPQFHLYDPAASTITTIRDLLSHRTGVPRHDLALWLMNRTRESLIPQAVYLPPTDTIRNQWQYNNWMVSVAGSISAWLNGFGLGNGNWESLVHRNIFQPLNMSRTTANFSETLPVSNRANVLYSTAAGQWTNGDWKANLLLDAGAPAAGVNSCVDDMLKWIQVHLSNSAVPLVSAATLAEMHHGNIVVNLPGVPADMQQFFYGASYGLGWVEGNYRGHRRVQHDGDTLGFSSMVSLLPDDGIGFFAVTNSADAPPRWAYTVSVAVFDLALGLEPTFNISTACNSPCSIFPNYPPCMPPASDKQTMHNAPRSHAADRPGSSMPGHSADFVASALDYVAMYSHPAYAQINVSMDANGSLQATTWLSKTGQPVTAALALIRGEVFSWINSPYSPATIEFVRSQRTASTTAVISLTLYYIKDVEYHITFTNANYQSDDQNMACPFSSTSGVQYVSMQAAGAAGPQGAPGSNGQSSDLTAGMLALTIILSVVGSSLLATGIALYTVRAKARGKRNSLFTSAGLD